MGTPCDMIRSGAESILIGFIVGIISVTGFNNLTNMLSKKEILHDSCGVLNLHCIPGLIGALIGWVQAAISEAGDFGDEVPLTEIINKRTGTPGSEDRSATA